MIYSLIDYLKNNNMKKNSFFFFFLMLVLSTKAQVSTTLTVQTAPTAILSEWSVRNAIVTLIVTKVDSIPQQAIFKTEIKLIDGTVIGVTDITKATPVILTKGTRVYFSKDVMPLEIMSFTGKYKTILDRTGKLPADNYQFCVQLLSQGPLGLQPLVAAKCKFFNMAALQLPILVMPANHAVLNKLVAQTAITFRWSPLIPQTLPPPTYRLQVFEILANQQPVQALRSNQPLLDVSVRAITQYIWRPGLAFNTTDSLPLKFIWTLQTLDDTGLPAVQTDGNGESRSEPFIFAIGTSATIEKRKGKG